MIFVEECSGAKSVTLFVRGSTKHIVDEIVRAIEDVPRVVAATVEDDKVVAGGGAPEIAMAVNSKTTQNPFWKRTISCKRICRSFRNRTKNLS